MPTPDLTKSEVEVLRAVHTQEGADLYELARIVGMGPRTVQESIRQLAQDDLVHVSDRGFRVECTRAGDDWVRHHR